MKASTRAVQGLFKRNLTIATAESCTGGMIASELVGYSGISEVFLEGFVTYSNDAKKKSLGVKADTLADFGAVSENTAREMAVGARKACGASIGLTTTGIAGPDGGTAEKPVGLVFISCAVADKVITRRYTFSGNRQQIRLKATKAAFMLLAYSIDTYTHGE